MADGVFALAMLVVGGVGFVGACRASGRVSGWVSVGAFAAGWGVFNVVDGVVSHWVLGVHDAVEGAAGWNGVWVAVSVVWVLASVGVAVGGSRTRER